MSRRRPPRPDVVEAPSFEVGKRATPQVQACPGPCNRAYRVAEQAADTERATATTEHRLPDPAITGHSIRPHLGRPVWCVDVPQFNDQGEATGRLTHHGCTHTILDNLTALTDLATWLTPGRLNTPRSTDIDHTSSKSGGAKALAHAPSPSPGWDTADELIRWLVDLEDWLRSLTTDTPNKATTRTLSGATRYLAGHAPALFASGDAERVGLDVLSAHRRLTVMVGQDRLTHRLTEPCPRCARKGLQRRDGDELVKCRSCHAVWDWDHFELLSRAYAETVKAGKGATA